MNNIKYIKKINSVEEYIFIGLIFSTIMNLNVLGLGYSSIIQVTFLIATMLIVQSLMKVSITKNAKLNINIGHILFILATFLWMIIGLINSNIENVVYIAFKVFINYIIIYYFIKIIKTQDHTKFIIRYITYFGVILSLFGILEYLDIFYISKLFNVYKWFPNSRIGTVWIDPNEYGYALLFLYSVTLNNKINIKELGIKVLYFLSILTTGSRSSLLMFIIINIINIIINIIYEIIIKKRIKVIKPQNIIMCLLLLFITIVPLYYTLDYINFDINKYVDIKGLERFSRMDSNGRLESLFESIEIGMKNPLIGVGIQNIPKYTSNLVSAHNMYANIFGESGIVPLLFYIMLILYLFAICIKLLKLSTYINVTTSLFVLMICYSFFSHTIFQNNITGLLIGLILSQYQISRKEFK